MPWLIPRVIVNHFWYRLPRQRIAPADPVKAIHRRLRDGRFARVALWQSGIVRNARSVWAAMASDHAPPVARRSLTQRKQSTYFLPTSTPLPGTLVSVFVVMCGKVISVGASPGFRTIGIFSMMV